MDQAMLQALAKSYGAPNTNENMNRIREFYANDPQAAERRIYGVKGYSGESTGDRDAILNAMLDRTMTGGVNGAPNTEPQMTVMPDVQAASAPTQRSANAGAPRGTRGGASGGGVVVEPSMQPGFTDTSEVTSPTIGAPQGGGGGVMDWLLPLLIGVGGAGALVRSIPGSDGQQQNRGRGAGAGGAGSRNVPAIEGANPNQKRIGYTPKLPDESGPKMPSGATEIPKGAPQRAAAAAQDPAEVARMKAEVDAENRGASALQEQMLQREKAQRSTRELGKAARRATGRL